MRMRKLLLSLIFLTGTATAELEVLLDYQLLGDGGAYVSSGFHDWRTVSKYRSRPGLHAGYDIAMLAGSPVRAAWPGTVVALTPWYGSEWGVTVRDANGYEATYGHISPGVTVGDQVQPGDVLGLVVVDHVDVKVRNSKGIHVDFATLDLESHYPSSQDFLEKTQLQKAQLAERLKLMKADWQEANQAYSLGLIPRKRVIQLAEELQALQPNFKAKKFVEDEVVTAIPPVERPVTDSLLNSTHAPDF